MRQVADNALRLRRVLLNLAFLGWFAVVAFRLGPNVILFHKLTRMSPDDFVPIVEKYCVPAVHAIKQYERTNGRFPATMDELGAPFSSHQGTGPGMHLIDGSRLYT